METKIQNTLIEEEQIDFRHLTEFLTEFFKTPSHQKLEIEKIFSSGSQGVCGLVKIDVSKGKKKKQKPVYIKVVFKVSQYIDYIIEHEYKAMKLLEQIYNFCPHYSLAYNVYSANTEAKIKEDENPFIVTSKYPIRRKFILEEYIEGLSFKQLLNDEECSKNMFVSTVKQVLASINISGKKLNFSHYDLHSSNILIAKCNPDEVNFYIFEGDGYNGLLVPTFGTTPKIIDMGFAYAKGMVGTEVTVDLSHSDHGYFCDRYCWLTDYKVFLMSLCSDVKDVLKDSDCIFDDENGGDQFINIVKNIFKPIGASWTTGWDKYKNEEATDKTLRRISEIVRIKSGLFKESPHACFDIIISMCTFPLVETKTFQTDMRICYPVFLSEFEKIESEMTVPVYKLNMLKTIVDNAKIVKAEYMNIETRGVAVSKFKVAVETEMTRISKYCLPRINYEMMLCSLYSLAYCYAGLLKRYLDATYNKITETYDLIVPKTGNEIVEIFNINFEDKYMYSSESVINVYDSVGEKTTHLQLLPEEVEKINSLPHYAKGEYVYTLYKSV